MSDDLENITRLLVQARDGTPGAMEEVFASVYPRLRELAKSRRRNWQNLPTMDTTSLIHEAYLKVASSKDAKYADRGHFFAVAAKAMRQVLINYAEKKNAAKRGGGANHVTLQDDDAVQENTADNLLSMEQALKKLEAMSPRQGQVVECLFFAGLDISETAEALGISPATVKRDWAAARAWLYREMQDSDPS